MRKQEMGNLAACPHIRFNIHIFHTTPPIAYNTTFMKMGSVISAAKIKMLAKYISGKLT